MPLQRPPTKIVYIAGYGRSGTTLLDTVLGNHPQMFGAGELTWLFRYASQGETCTCGKALAACPVWASVLQRVATAIGSDNLGMLAETSLQAETFRRDRKRESDHRTIWRAVFRAIHNLTDCPAVVDSSKSTRRTYHRLALLNQVPDTELYVIHLVRDPRAVMWSTRRGSNRRLEADLDPRIPGGTARALLSWLTANRNVRSYCRRQLESRYLCVRYEDLAANAADTLQAIGDFLGCDLATIGSHLAGESPLASGHGVSGNRMRRSGAIRWRVDDEWRSNHHLTDRILAQLARPWIRPYGYDR